MQELANQLMAYARNLSEAPDPNTTPAGQGELDVRLRVGIWPVVCETAPELGLGVTAALAALLAHWPSVIVYRLLVQPRGEPESFHWSVADSQFDVDDWQLEYLDENVGMWGALTEKVDGWALSLSIENDLGDGDTVTSLDYSAEDILDLVEMLPQIAGDVARQLGAGSVNPINPPYEFDSEDEDAVVSLLVELFRWERDLFLALWGVDFDDTMLKASIQRLLEAADAVSGDFGGWCVATAVRDALRTGTGEVYEPALEGIWITLATRFGESPSAVLIASLGQPTSDEETQHVTALEAAVRRFPSRVDLRLGLAEVQRRAGDVRAVIETLQAAIEAEVVSPSLYFMYGALMSALRQNGLVANSFVLIDAPDRQLDRMTEEAAAAFEAGLADVDNRPDMIQRWLMQLVELADEQIWDVFEQLLNADTRGEYIRAAVEAFAMLESIDEGLDLLRAAVERQPERVDLRVSLAAALLLDDQSDAAIEHLEAAEELTDDQSVIADIERLLLSAADPEFEMRLGEITELVDARKPVPARDVGFLEDALENAQSFAQGYLLLARAHLVRDQQADALEVLLDGQNYLPEDPEITELLARVLWDSDERDLAFDYLNKGLANHPDHVPLLALTGRYLFEVEQDDEARTLLGRAQSLNPRDRALQEAQRYIAQKLGRSLV